MADIRPFRGLRFDSRVVGDLASVVTPPYDVIDDAAQREFYRRSPHSVIRIELGQILPGDSAENNRYSRSASFLRDWLGEGSLRIEPEPAMYLYQHSFLHNGQAASRLGLFAALRLEEWDRRIVRPHELTMAGPKLDRLQLMRATSVNCSPIFVLYSDPTREARDSLHAAIDRRPEISLRVDDEEHKLWALYDRALLAPLAKVVRERPVYIADGHHRYETALHFRNERREANAGFTGDEAWNFVLALLVDVDDPGLVVLPTHRLVNPRTAGAELAAELARCCSLEAVESSGNGQDDLAGLLRRLAGTAHGFGLFGKIGDDAAPRYALLRPRQETLSARPGTSLAARLDVSMLLDVVLRGACGLTVEDSEDEARLAYTRDAAGAVRAVQSGAYRLAFFLNPAPVNQVLAVADAGEVMPHKSTYFHPKPLTGLVMSALEETLRSI